MNVKLKQMEEQLAVWTDKIDLLVATAQESNGWARIDLRQGIDELKVKRALFRTQLDKFQAAGSESREDLSDQLKSTFKDLEDALKEMSF